MATHITIDPVTRLEGHLRVEVRIETLKGVQQVVDAWSTGTLFRGFEQLLQNRNPLDAPHITQRICGVCPIPHATASVQALEKASKTTIPPNARIMRNLVQGANFVQSHILSFYHLSALDYINGPDMPPWKPVWNIDRRIDSSKTTQLVNNYLKAIEMTRKGLEASAIFGGRFPHTPAFVPGGITSTPTVERIAKFRTYLNELISFISNTYIPDVRLLASVYGDYYYLGRGHANLLAFGVFDLDVSGGSKLLKRGRAVGGSQNIETVDLAAIHEDVTFSWYADSTNHLNPSVGETVPQHPKGEAYSWLKAPRYLTEPYETGPLARMWINGNYRNGISAMDRHMARASEALMVAKAMLTWLSQISVGKPVYVRNVIPTVATGYGLTEAPRGALGHWVEVYNGTIAHYQIVTPTCWNASPMDQKGIRGPIEEALIGTPVKDMNQPVEVLRVIHSFDPCLSCAVHVVRTDTLPTVFTLSHSEERQHCNSTD